MTDPAGASAAVAAALAPDTSAPAPPIASDASAPLEPVTASERIASVDVLRGFAVLGILWMNILTFGLPYWAYRNPSVYGGATGIDLAAWLASAVLVEGKMRAIFSMLFGASLVLITSRAETRGARESAADIYLRRSLWLAGIGLLHAYLLWWGDILFYYGVVGLGLYPFRRLSPRALAALGLLVLAVSTPQAWLETGRALDLRERAAAADAAAEAGLPLTAEQEKARRDWEKTREQIEPSEAEVARQIEIHRGSYLQILAERAEYVVLAHTVEFYRWMLFDVAGMMLLGMALFKLGVLSAGLERRAYLAMALGGFAVCLPISLAVSLRELARGFELAPDALRDTTYDLARLAGAIGWIGLVMLACRSTALLRLRMRLASAGQMALTNYLLQTVVCTALFYGYGLGLFGRLARHQLLLIALGIWAVQLWLSPLWLRRFRFGPVEWAWRSLTYWRRQPMHRSARA